MAQDDDDEEGGGDIPVIIGGKLAMPETLANVITKIIRPTFAEVLPGKFASPEAVVMLLAIGLQESRFQHRKQLGGPARGFWQFENGGGARGVIEHWSTATHADAVCALRGVATEWGNVYNRLAYDDLLACAFARLLLYTDPAQLPEVGDHQAAWDYYLRNWRPGKPHPETWRGLYAQAVQALMASYRAPTGEA
jgi:hypothetical protein